MASEARSETGWVARCIEWSAARPVWILVLTTLAIVLGVGAMLRTPLDAMPDLSDTQVIVFTDWHGQSPLVVEEQVTWPLTSQLLGTRGVRAVRGQSSFGMSFIYVIFEDGTDGQDARTLVMEQLDQARRTLPEGVQPTMGPDASGVGWVLQYALLDDSGELDLADLRALQDWNVRLALESLPDVVEVAAVGGAVRQYQVELDPSRLIRHQITAGEVGRAIRKANVDSGGGSLEIAGHEHAVRGVAALRDMTDLEWIPIRPSTTGGSPLLLKELATVSYGPGPRRGIADLDGEGEVVGGVVVMRSGANALDVIRAVKGRIAEIQAGLPGNARIEVTYDRSELIHAATRTLQTTLFEEGLLVAIVVLLFLRHLRTSVVILVTLPVAAVLAFIPMMGHQITANIMSLGGIAVAFGAMVDGGIVVVENVHRRLAQWQERPDGRRRERVMVSAMVEVGPTIFFSLLVIMVSFAPVFLLEAQEGRLFQPLAFTKTYTMGLGALLAVTLVPALVMLVVRGEVQREEDSGLHRWLVQAYVPVVRWSIAHRRGVVMGAVGLVVASIPIWGALDTEFMPPLREGDLLYMPTSPPGMSSTEAGKVLQVSDRIIAEIPEVAHVFGKIGRAETATDPAPMSMIETTISLKPTHEWRAGLTWEGLIEELDAKLQIPGMPNLFWMPIQTRTEMLATGVRTPLAVQVFGDDLERVGRVAKRIETVLRTMPSRPRVTAERTTGGFYVDVELDRARAAQMGVRASDLEEAIGMAVGGQTVTQIVDGRARFDVSVRYHREFRDNPEALERVLVPTLSGEQVALRSVAKIKHVTGPPVVRSENGQLVSYVFVDPGALAVGTFTRRAQRLVERDVDLESGVRLGWTGQFEHLERAQHRLLWVLPLTLALVCLLLYANTGSLVQSSIILLSVPFSLIGAVGLVWMLDYNLSVAVWVGMIALAGLDAEMGAVMLLYLTLSHQRRSESGELNNMADLTEAVVDGAAYRIRPKLMTVLCTMLGLAPLMWSTGAGADVMQRMAAPMVGGLATSFLLELVVYPAVFSWWKSGALPSAEGHAA